MSFRLSDEDQRRLCEELRKLTGATNPRWVGSRKRGRNHQHVITASLTLAGNPLRYFYGVFLKGQCAENQWSRFKFEGDVQDFLAWHMPESDPWFCDMNGSRYLETLNQPSDDPEIEFPTRRLLLRRDQEREPPKALVSPHTIDVSLASTPSKDGKAHILRLPREVRDLCYDHLRLDTLVVISRRDLTVIGGANAGFVFYDTPFEHPRTQHLLRADDRLGYINLILDFKGQNRGDNAVHQLDLAYCCFQTIWTSEQEALEQELPPVNANEMGLWVMPLLGAGKEGSGSSK
ncbi:hypothetical protein M409DRAFT_20834 [Zasmidium cellare ATCC 36951]|uniref:Uncharacterized protein n=1 Tax=Zasmidium cellare ATCC 36951 TaxID=1080233 RepID=A0A6A6CRL8_ZASCE|nr:uncharacterized protein M409DRAFT_20834 [Zasmidium cellare ATCC 36951]KAF2168818.1 hypothetical protein M409DRAFT_20834 [Zasmidium cellare ATCC 36951]